MIKPRVTVDVNIFVSGTIVKRGNPFLLLEAWRKRLFTLVISQAVISELTTVLHRPQIQKTYQISPDEITDLLEAMERTSTVCVPQKVLPVTVRDPKDEIILATALGGKTNYLVTGDKDLLVLKNSPKLEQVKIMTVDEFLKFLEAGNRF